MQASSIAYSAAACGYGALCLYLLKSPRRYPFGYGIVAAAGLSGLWAAAGALVVSAHSFSRAAFVALELARDAGWLTLLTGTFRELLPRWLRRTVVGTCLVLLTILLIPGIDPDRELVRQGLVAGLAGLILVEQVYRNSESQHSKALVPLLAVVGGQAAYDLFLYGQATMFGVIDSVSFSLRPVVLLFLLPFLVLAVRKNVRPARHFVISRQVVFYSSALVAVGLYLCAMALGGYYIRSFGGSWGKALQLVFLLGAGALLTSLFWSADGRRWFRVVITKHFYHSKYDYRAEWFRFARALANIRADQAFAGVVQIVAQMFGSERGFLYLIDESGSRYRAVAVWDTHGHDVALPPDVEASAAMIQLLANGAWIIDLGEAHAAMNSRTNVPEWLAADPNLRVVAPVPHGTELLGFIVLATPPPPFEMDYEDRDLLISATRHVATYLAKHAADRRREESRQFEAYLHVGAFLMHDLKNAVAQLQLVVANATQFRHDPHFIDDAMSTIENAAHRIAGLTERLRLGDYAAVVKPTLLREAIEGAMLRCSDRVPRPALRASADTIFVRADREHLVSALENVIRNAQDATPATGNVELELRIEGQAALVTVNDTGKGMDFVFLRDRLFRPFDSTKGASGMGVGAFQAREYIRSIGGLVDVQSVPGQGTCFTIQIPTHRQAADHGD